MTIDHFPTDLCPTIKDACGEVRLVDREAGVDFLRSDVRFGSLAVVQHSTILMSAFGGHSGRSPNPTPREVDSPGSLRPLATVPEPIAVLEVPLIAA